MFTDVLVVYFQQYNVNTIKNLLIYLFNFIIKIFDKDLLEAFKKKQFTFDEIYFTINDVLLDAPSHVFFIYEMFLRQFLTTDRSNYCYQYTIMGSRQLNHQPKSPRVRKKHPFTNDKSEVLTRF